MSDHYGHDLSGPQEDNAPTEAGACRGTRSQLSLGD
jgi:hypothetical protein